MVVGFDQQPVLPTIFHLHEGEFAPELQAEYQKHDLTGIILGEWITLSLERSVIPDPNFAGPVFPLADSAFKINIA